MKSKLKELFNYNTTERNGIIVLLVLILIMGSAPYFMDILDPPKVPDISKYDKEITAFLEGIRCDTAEKKTDQASKIRTIVNSEITPIACFPFDPNEIGENEWKKLGLTDRQVKTILNYRAKGGHFYQKEDLKKIYGLKEVEYNRLEPFIILPTRQDKLAIKKNEVGTVREPLAKINLNTADTLELVLIKGIGPSFARRIYKYRNLLGGFYDINQLMEVYGFDQEKLEAVKARCEIGEGPQCKFDLNMVTSDELRKHPYFDYYTAKAIIDRRLTKGKYSSLDQLAQITSIPTDRLEKIRHYLKVGNGQ